jgi:SH3 domain protein
MDQLRAQKTILVILFVMTVALIDGSMPLFADTRYVSDLLIISVREGRNKDDQVLGYLKTAAPVEVLEEKDRYLRIKTEDGMEGWVLKQYIVQDKPKAWIIEDMRKEVMDLKENIKMSKNNQGVSPDELTVTKLNYEKKIKTLEETKKRNQEITSALKNELTQTNEKYKNLVNNSKTTDELLRRLEKLKKENTKLKTASSDSKKQSDNPLKSKTIQWFFAGAVVFIVGYIIGGSARRKKRSHLYR